jgi:hypothetical protein
VAIRKLLNRCPGREISTSIHLVKYAVCGCVVTCGLRMLAWFSSRGSAAAAAYATGVTDNSISQTSFCARLCFLSKIRACLCQACLKF